MTAKNPQKQGRILEGGGDIFLAQEYIPRPAYTIDRPMRLFLFSLTFSLGS